MQLADRKSDAKKNPKNAAAKQITHLEKSIYDFRNNCKHLLFNTVNFIPYLPATIALGQELQRDTKHIAPTLSNTIEQILIILNNYSDSLRS